MTRSKGIVESKIQNRKSKIDMTPRAKVISRIVMMVIAVGVFVADQVSKAMVMRHIHDNAIVPVIPGFFNLTSSKNSGAVFGMFNDAAVWWKTPLLIVVSLALLIAVVALVVRTQNLHSATKIGLSLVLGGALANLFDRIRAGEVEDFLDFYFRTYHWYTFNLADGAIVVGTGLIILQVMLGEQDTGDRSQKSGAKS
jgi:signal peptidase II